MELESAGPTSSQHGKQAACLNCRRSKIRCNRQAGESSCEKCKQTNAECIVPNHHLGRQKGVKNKRKGLEKAIHQIEQAIKRPKVDSASDDEAQRAISVLQDLLGQARGQLVQNEHEHERRFSETSDHPRMTSPRDIQAEDGLTLDDAENPLQLLARASNLQISPVGTRRAPVSPLPLSEGPSLYQNTSQGEQAAKSFFVPAGANLDVGPDMDPIGLGLVTFDESESLFSFFYQHLAHTRWGLDPLIHTPSFVRSQSAFLFTSIMAGAALFLPSASALSKRLSRHCKWLAKRVITQRYKSVEIVLAFMVNVPWMSPGDRLGDDDTCSYIAMALTVALDLSLNKIISPSSSFDQELMNRLARAECIDAKRALHMDGFHDIDPSSEWGVRLLRRRERAWIALYVVERGVCLARGRSYTVPSTTLIENCDRWHLSNIADPRDGPMSSVAVLRRDLDGLFQNVKSSCDNYRIVDTGSEAAQSIKKTIQTFYERWYATWALSIGEGDTRSLPPYVEILVTHTQLSTYGGVINHRTAPIEVKRFFRAAGLSSALNVLRAAIQGESRLKSMPNNTVIMISFAACSALSLSVTPGDSKSSLAPSVRNLIEETAGVLERIGATPSHRSGASVLYGRFLRELIRRAPAFPLQSRGNLGEVHPSEAFQSACLDDRPLPVAIPEDLWFEPLQFSAMSDDQIVDAVNRAGTAFGASIPDVPLDDMLNWDWLDSANADFNLQ
ncbi:transcriptional regulator family: Fungal Specific TF [Penicillium roqueforti]|uniref:transcriptional regulator family: Fungal Specific TF n=1 Tax=Penicillium roqueforti TaxID=5082 RepID=UPI00190D9F29|nr:transcriptional regulator family: Fungal Specific TF [Penicillium roqueforti]KAF9247861.1 transcriptional regulator family: Fungal Specific TF [Penicillium roqueforti]KAI1836945.1 transcriptional regulator family: Fungal Specific TF [Penicillium roqueforti]KAI2678003.1 transcriptional regulator family: Fungal Specific TF [Penicillium roqueforti]KAI2759257.1 transcriptional regulator family: Fungal Specific TF [Penicillium roqueforti]KAI3116140.1 transcriptional regulator family: Fungal Spec